MAKNQLSFTPDQDVKALIEKYQKKWNISRSKVLNRLLISAMEKSK